MVRRSRLVGAVGLAKTSTMKPWPALSKEPGLALELPGDTDLSLNEEGSWGLTEWRSALVQP